MTATIAAPVTAEREVAERIAHRMSQIGWVEDNDFIKALSQEGHPGLELLVDGLRYLVSVELRGREYQIPRPANVWADGSVEEVLF